MIYCPRIDRYLSASRDKTIKYWSLNSDIPEFNLLSHDLVVTALSSNKENDMLMSGSRDNKLVLWDLKTGRIISNAQISRNLVKKKENTKFYSRMDMNIIKFKSLLRLPMFFGQSIKIC